MATYLIEVGTEELPADFVAAAIAQLKDRVSHSLTEYFLTPDGIEVYGTPRRLAVLIQGLPDQQADREEEIKGPPAAAAFKEGQPTKAAEGFARKQGVELSALEVRPTEKGDFVFVQKKTLGRPTPEILQELVLGWFTALEGRRFMRWADGDLRFPRPIRWLVSLWNDAVLPLELVNGSGKLEAGRISRGHRILHQGDVTLNNAADYVVTLQQAFVEVNPQVREEKIVAGVKAAAAEIGGEAEMPADLLAEVVNLVEYPTAVVGDIEAEFLELPTEVITTVMVTHQRYFAVRDRQDKTKLLPKFITISNGDPKKSEIIAAGNGRVIRARLADGQFFYRADCDEHLETYLPQLEAVTFQEELGTMRDKVDRIMEISQQIAEQLGLSEADKEIIASTAMLCKADLVTQMVYEFPELQGIMGQKYALVSGEAPAVAEGIFEHYLPRNADDILPQTLAGQVVGMGDRLDTLVSIFGLGMIPSGSSDPFALRRAANAIITVAWDAGLEIDLGELLAQGAKDFVTAHPDKTSPLEALQSFFIQRIQTLLQDEKGIDYDLVNAVLGDDAEYTERALTDLLDVGDRAAFLQSIRDDGQLAKIYATVNRSAKLAAKGNLSTDSLDPTGVINPEKFAQNSERDLYAGLVELVPTTEVARTERDYQKLIDGLAALAPTVERFFDGEDSVLVMAEDPAVRENRLNLLGLLRNHARVLADFGAIVKQ
ncbi:MULTISPECIES: glycine--tRNA ligase subunit beta [Cyanophyceae]|uniref:Glycine--tRNA ligase beta subunit n=1 Tax=Picosynechococcus sp. (strain ATCC 27264 / PCC 7002 / PR-6) TaxID=32049 RepID=SYGB_PICP2|nr:MULTISPECIES: glycine--tRNA ligase subunit beta [Cyanophyceae]B1XK79.1 RecName: Full=Glycine--tRNA ligase beta subunit; AltName: Full=Glycyl-tRNA synthetase beta subunit; Short=GlyRS [Picosynechococcus sp. PCC 7002]ACB00434.1 glycyl-tRNA synthetase, beta subunit [Picosynechococcus sp. PCC 7002]SMH49329.1 glycyl-tRNA synthetase beta chain [Picosynechococcus sp. OG1]SMQ81551.1 glycyl-tRNA synthetase beta chain [Synechococcus sp. 7002]